MIWRVTASREAEADIADATDWYEEQRNGLGSRFLEDVRSIIELIASNPLQYAMRYRDARRALLHRFPYALIFRVADSEVRLVGCFHTSRDPRRWQARVRRS